MQCSWVIFQQPETAWALHNVQFENIQHLVEAIWKGSCLSCFQWVDIGKVAWILYDSQTNQTKQGEVTVPSGKHDQF